MSKAPSDATLLRALKRKYADLLVEHQSVDRERINYRARATKAEQEAAEWKARFDLLLRKDQKK